LTCDYKPGRATFIVHKNGTIKKMYGADNIDAKKHVDEVFEGVNMMLGGS
jgi:peroxiredoxin